jgi:hypothetical protein
MATREELKQRRREEFERIDQLIYNEITDDPISIDTIIFALCRKDRGTRWYEAKVVASLKRLQTQGVIQLKWVDWPKRWAMAREHKVLSGYRGIGTSMDGVPD